MSDMKSYIESIGKKHKEFANSPTVKSAPRRSASNLPIQESKQQKLQTFINAFSEVLYRHGLNNDKINQIVEDLYGTSAPVVEYQQQDYQAPYQQPRVQPKSQPRQQQYQQQQYQQYQQYQQPYPQQRMQPQRAQDPVNYANSLLGEYDSYSNDNYQTEHYPEPPTSNMHSGIYRDMNNISVQNGYGNVYAPSDTVVNPSGQIHQIPMHEGLMKYLPNKLSVPTNIVNMPTVATPNMSNPITTNVVDIDYGTNLL